MTRRGGGGGGGGGRGRGGRGGEVEVITTVTVTPFNGTCYLSLSHRDSVSRDCGEDQFIENKDKVNLKILNKVCGFVLQRNRASINRSNCRW
jgi:hypothetical protein